MTKLILNVAFLAIVFIISETFAKPEQSQFPWTTSSLPLKRSVDQTFNPSLSRNNLNRLTSFTTGPNDPRTSRTFRNSNIRLGKFNTLIWVSPNQDKNQLETLSFLFCDVKTNKCQSVTFRKCCINENCHVLQKGEECGDRDELMNDENGQPLNYQSFTKRIQIPETSDLPEFLDNMLNINGNKNGYDIDTNQNLQNLSDLLSSGQY